MVRADIEVVTGRLCNFEMCLWRSLVLFPISTQLHTWPGILDRIHDEHERATGRTFDLAAPFTVQVGLNPGATVLLELVTVGPCVLGVSVSASGQKLILDCGTRVLGNDAQAYAKANCSAGERTLGDVFQGVLPGVGAPQNDSGTPRLSLPRDCNQFRLQSNCRTLNSSIQLSRAAKIAGRGVRRGLHFSYGNPLTVH